MLMCGLAAFEIGYIASEIKLCFTFMSLLGTEIDLKLLVVAVVAAGIMK